MALQLPSPDRLYIFSSQAGAIKEGRATRKGGSNSEISYLTDRQRISDPMWTEIIPEGMPFPVQELQFKVDVKTHLPIEVIGPCHRYEAVGSWLLSYQEILRHLVLIDEVQHTDLYMAAIALAQSLQDELIDLFITLNSIIISHGDFSFEQFDMYAHEHKDSASPFEKGLRWGEIVSERAKTSAWTACNKFVREWDDQYPRLVKRGFSLIDAENSYAGLRPRPGKVDMISSKDYLMSFWVRMWRSRKVGGIKGLSQLTYPAYSKTGKSKANKMIYEAIQRWVLKYLNLKVELAALEGAQTYLDLLASEWHYYDVRMSEKQVALLIPWSLQNLDLGDPRFSKDNAAEMQSGVGFTGPVTLLGICLILKASYDVFSYIPGRIKMGGDNIAVSNEYPVGLQRSLDTSDRFLGFQVKPVPRYGPPSLVTDSPDHRLSLKFPTTQEQHIQSGYRVLQGVIQNSLAHPQSCQKYLDWIQENKIDLELLLHDKVEKYVNERADLREKLIDKFSLEREWIERWWGNQIQWERPEYSSDLRVTYV